jgi:ectoine hydroxylase
MDASRTAIIAIDPLFEANGCLQLVPGSHRTGRTRHTPVGQSQGADPERVQRIIAERGTALCELEPGDVVFFHSNTLHASGPNTIDGTRTIFHASYNAVHADPGERAPSFHRYHPLETIPDEAILSSDCAMRLDEETLRQRQARRAEMRKDPSRNLYKMTTARQGSAGHARASAYDRGRIVNPPVHWLQHRPVSTGRFSFASGHDRVSP